MRNNIGIDIAKYLNKVNNYMFTDEEVNECAIDYDYMIANNHKDSIIKVLKEEYTNTNDNIALELIKNLSGITCGKNLEACEKEDIIATED